MTVGFIGVGHIVTAVVTGLCSTHPQENILLSPRNSINSAALSDRFARVSVAAGNQQVIDASDLLVLGLRPQDAGAVMARLKFRRDQTVVSLMALMPTAALRRLTAPASTIVRAVPLPSVARCQGPIALWPADPAVEALFNRIGRVAVTDTEEALHALWATTALAAPFYQLLHRVVLWLIAKGVTRQVATAYVGRLFQALSDPLDPPPEDLSGLAVSVSTRGGLNEQADGEFRRDDWYGAVDPVLDNIFLRLNSDVSKK
jgi:pyrroline-5-carboxylate reductase